MTRVDEGLTASCLFGEAEQRAAGDFITPWSCYNRRGVINRAPWRLPNRDTAPTGLSRRYRT